jgi:hypothetical protein
MNRDQTPGALMRPQFRPQSRSRLRQLAAMSKRVLLLIPAILLPLAACGDGPRDPRPPHSPPKPVMLISHVITTQFILHARPVPPSPGMM